MWNSAKCGTRKNVELGKNVELVHERFQEHLSMGSSSFRSALALSILALKIEIRRREGM